MTTALEPWQRAGADFIQRCGGVAYLAMEPGTGKTLTALDRICDVGGPWMVVCPRQAMHTWAEEVAAHKVPVDVVILDQRSIPERIDALRATPTRGTVVTVIPWETLSSPKQANRDRLVRAVKARMPRGIVVDEAHWGKGFSRRASTVLRMAKGIPFRLLLSGTPVSKDYTDLYMQWKILDPPGNPWHDWTKRQWMERYCIFGGYQDKEVVGWQNLDEMNAEVARCTYHVSTDVLDLPGLSDHVVNVALGPTETAAYISMASQLATEVQGKRIRADNQLAKWLRLRQITSGFIGTEHGSLELGTAKLARTAELVRDLVSVGDQVVVFCQFTHDVAWLSQALGPRIDGSVKLEDRNELLKKFQDGKIQCLVCQIQTASVGINELVGAKHAVFVSVSPRRDEMVQATDRLYRRGQTEEVQRWQMVVPATVDEALLATFQMRTTLEEAMKMELKKYQDSASPTS